MIEFSQSDSSILTRVAQFNRVPREERRKLLKTASAKAQQVGRILMGEEEASSDPEITAAVNAFREWLEYNRRSRLPVRKG